MTPCVSIIVPVYNVERYLCKCVDSLLAQTCPDFEVLLIDDGSTDASGKLCDGYAAKDARVKAYHQPNGGVSKTRNAGIDNALGEWITFVDADDWLDRQYLEKLIYAQKKYNADLTMCEFINIDAETGKSSCRASFDGNVFYGKDEIQALVVPKTLDDSTGQMIGHPICKLYRASILKEFDIRFIERIRLHEDRMFNYEYAQYISSFYYLAETLYKRLLHSDSAMHVYRADIYQEYQVICTECERLLQKYGRGTDAENRYLNTILVSDILTNHVCSPQNTGLHRQKWSRYYSYLADEPMCRLKKRLKPASLYHAKERIRLLFIVFHQTWLVELAYKLHRLRRR